MRRVVKVTDRKENGHCRELGSKSGVSVKWKWVSGGKMESDGSAGCTM
jgi:hypothetical protein